MVVSCGRSIHTVPRDFDRACTFFRMLVCSSRFGDLLDSFVCISVRIVLFYDVFYICRFFRVLFLLCMILDMGPLRTLGHMGFLVLLRRKMLAGSPVVMMVSVLV